MTCNVFATFNAFSYCKSHTNTQFRACGNREGYKSVRVCLSGASIIDCFLEISPFAFSAACWIFIIFWFCAPHNICYFGAQLLISYLHRKWQTASPGPVPKTLMHKPPELGCGAQVHESSSSLTSYSRTRLHDLNLAMCSSMSHAVQSALQHASIVWGILIHHNRMAGQT